MPKYIKITLADGSEVVIDADHELSPEEVFFIMAQQVATDEVAVAFPIICYNTETKELLAQRKRNYLATLNTALNRNVEDEVFLFDTILPFFETVESKKYLPGDWRSQLETKMKTAYVHQLIYNEIEEKIVQLIKPIFVSAPETETEWPKELKENWSKVTTRIIELIRSIVAEQLKGNLSLNFRSISLLGDRDTRPVMVCVDINGKLQKEFPDFILELLKNELGDKVCECSDDLDINSPLKKILLDSSKEIKNFIVSRLEFCKKNLLTGLAKENYLDMDVIASARRTIINPTSVLQNQFVKFSSMLDRLEARLKPDKIGIPDIKELTELYSNVGFIWDIEMTRTSTLGIFQYETSHLAKMVAWAKDQLSVGKNKVVFPVLSVLPSERNGHWIRIELSSSKKNGYQIIIRDSMNAKAKGRTEDIAISYGEIIAVIKEALGVEVKIKLDKARPQQSSKACGIAMISADVAIKDKKQLLQQESEEHYRYLTALQEIELADLPIPSWEGSSFEEEVLLTKLVETKIETGKLLVTAAANIAIAETPAEIEAAKISSLQTPKEISTLDRSHKTSTSEPPPPVSIDSDSPARPLFNRAAKSDLVKCMRERSYSCKGGARRRLDFLKSYSGARGSCFDKDWEGVADSEALRYPQSEQCMDLLDKDDKRKNPIPDAIETSSEGQTGEFFDLLSHRSMEDTMADEFVIVTTLAGYNNVMGTASFKLAISQLIRDHTDASIIEFEPYKFKDSYNEYFVYVKVNFTQEVSCESFCGVLQHRTIQKCNNPYSLGICWRGTALAGEDKERFLFLYRLLIATDRYISWYLNGRRYPADGAKGIGLWAHPKAELNIIKRIKKQLSFKLQIGDIQNPFDENMQSFLEKVGALKSKHSLLRFMSDTPSLLEEQEALELQKQMQDWGWIPSSVSLGITKH